MGKLVETVTIDNDVYELYDVDEFEKDSTNEYEFPWFMYFDQSLILLNGKPKYLVGLYQDGEIWSEDEIYGTDIVDLETLQKDKHSDGYCGKGVKLGYFIDTDIISIIHEIKIYDIDEIYCVYKNT